MTDYEYLEELFGASVAKLTITSEHYDDWLETVGDKYILLRGKNIVSLTFETTGRLTSFEYGSIKIVSCTTDLSSLISTYKCLCLKGKETKDLLGCL